MPSPGQQQQARAVRQFVVGASAADASSPALREPPDAGAVSGLCERVLQRRPGCRLGVVDGALLVAFDEAHGALGFAVELHRAADGLAGRGRRRKAASLRIGIAAGKVVGGPQDASGDGVAFAVAVTCLAEAAGICVTAEVVQALKPDLTVGCMYMLDTSIPPRRKPVRIYRVSLDPADAGRVVEHRIGLWDEPGRRGS